MFHVEPFREAIILTGFGTIVNVASIIAGGLVGSLVIKTIPERVKTLTMQALGLSVILIGLKLAWLSQDLLSIILAMASGAALGELLQIEDRLQRLSERIQGATGQSPNQFTKTLVGVTLLFCVGPMAITGAFADGLRGDPAILYAKSVLDGIGALVFASVLGLAVILTAIPVFLYQMTLTLGAGLLARLLTESTLQELNATGGLLVLALGLNLTGLGNFRVGNLLPALLTILLITLTKSLF